MLTREVGVSGRLCFQVAHRILADANAAEDICQQSLLKAWEHRREIVNENALRAWLLRVVTNECLQSLRRRRTQARVLSQRASPDKAASAFEPGRQAALRESVVLALSELPETTRAVVVLRVMGGRSGNEVKAILGCSAAEVSRRLHEGLDMLRTSMADWSTAGDSAEASGSE
ncbi:MAG: sigma-70 family RNA polymerase sigma factor [Planctomycetota bacterium]|nr:sigma-70 family RNA polymerase sigma factor [Planctomycetota bacterium]